MIAFLFATALASLVVAFLLIRHVLRQPAGDDAMQRIAAAIQEGASAFLRRQYATIGMFAALLTVAIIILYTATGNSTLGWKTGLAFLAGACASGFAGFMGMYVSVRANLRTAVGATQSLHKALTIALRGGAVEGILVTALSLLGVAGLFVLYGGMENPQAVPLEIVGFAFGASFVALFAQLGGGIYTKAADVGADLVGKVEAGIPEDDPRNPAVIADLVGDNVGDCAGRGADIFESTAAENIGAMILGIALYPSLGIKGILFPLIVQAYGLIASLIGVLVVRHRGDEDPMRSLNRGYYVTAVLAAVGLAVTTNLFFGDAWLYFLGAGLLGMLVSLAFVVVTQYYTEHKHRSVRAIARASETGPATNIISGFAVGLESTALPVVIISAAIIGSYFLGEGSGIESGGLFGTAVATMGMLSSAAFILAMDTFGPITDNAGGIVEMSNAPEHVREKTDRLDAVGNTTKALTKGYAVGSAALAAFLLFSAYLTDADLSGVDLAQPVVFIGGLLGAALIFLFSSLAIRAVGKAAYAIIQEVRRQFREKPGIMQGTDQPDYSSAVDIATKSALKEMVLPGVLAIAVPTAVGFLLGAEAVGATLMVGTIVGILMALLFNNAGGAWDNAKKFLEASGKKGTDVHKAAVVGDTVGDPFKDTAGPSLHVLIKLLATLTLVLAPFFVR